MRKIMNCELYHGDTIEIMSNLRGNCIDMILCDLPYGTTACKWDTIITFESLWEQYKRLIKPNGAIVLFGQEPFSSIMRLSNIKDYKYDWIWDKVKPGAFATAKYAPLKQHELISVFYQDAGAYKPQMIPRDKIKKSKIYTSSDSASVKYNDGIERTYDELYPKTIIVESNANQRGKVHPTQKPVPLCEYLIKTYTNEGMIVLDNTMGSGTTGVACVNINRNFIGIERDENYFNIACKRIEQATAQQMMFA